MTECQATYAAYEATISRDPQWDKESKAFLKENVKCICCQQDSEVVHHFIPVHVEPALEMVRSNWRAVCHACHFSVCHACNWQKWDVYLDKASRMIREGTRQKPRPTMGATMPVRRFKTIEEGEDAYADKELECVELRKDLENAIKNGENSIGGFLRRSVTEKVLLAIVAIFAVGGVGTGVGAWYQSDKNSKKLDQGRETQQVISEKVDDAATKAEDAATKAKQVSEKVDDVHREVKKKKGPFGE